MMIDKVNHHFSCFVVIIMAGLLQLPPMANAEEDKCHDAFNNPFDQYEKLTQSWPHLFRQIFLSHKWSLTTMAYAAVGNAGRLSKYGTSPWLYVLYPRASLSDVSGCDVLLQSRSRGLPGHAG
jgi:hypothetical protein